MNGDLLLARALDALGSLGDPLAREALEAGEVELERGVASWEGSHGTVEAHRVLLVLPEELHARVAASPAAHDGLVAAFAASIAAADPRASLYDLRLRPGAVPPRVPRSPYR